MWTFGDPATGSACGCFAGWAVQNAFAPNQATFTVGQGYEIGRPSLLQVQVTKGDDAKAIPTKVKVGGKVIPVIENGHITLQ